eukprot:12706936-Alexandrium_andersonii.AAC.1
MCIRDRERPEKARVHMEFVIKLYESQLGRGAHFLREHPATASRCRGCWGGLRLARWSGICAAL